ncbi:20926_t:CDS:2 [Cetraspora pellucida]|uniref:20926_t:CDS:1 n=1 Tax=Cetraspora pellucida TaxID=1433469 RepID=A0A9N9B5I5_9GLOM|nr:20926_t:CDS:2 [Cetraspora pellucida]
MQTPQQNTKLAIDMLKQYLNDLYSEETELYKQAEAIENSIKKLPAYKANSVRLNYQTRNIYTSKSLNFQELPKPTNADVVSKPMDFVETPYGKHDIKLIYA